jgi:hypothetical protein
MNYFKEDFEITDFYSRNPERENNFLSIRFNTLESLIKFSEISSKLKDNKNKYHAELAEFHASICFKNLKDTYFFTGRIPEEIMDRYVTLCLECVMDISDVNADSNHDASLLKRYASSILEKSMQIEELAG